jgi:hypothetical protein
VARTWRQRQYWASVRRNLIFVAFVGFAGAGVTAWLHRAPDPGSRPAFQHQGNGLNLR